MMPHMSFLFWIRQNLVEYVYSCEFVKTSYSLTDRREHRFSQRCRRGSEGRSSSSDAEEDADGEGRSVRSPVSRPSQQNHSGWWVAISFCWQNINRFKPLLNLATAVSWPHTKLVLSRVDIRFAGSDTVWLCGSSCCLSTCTIRAFSYWHLSGQPNGTLVQMWFVWLSFSTKRLFFIIALLWLYVLHTCSLLLRSQLRAAHLFCITWSNIVYPTSPWSIFKGTVLFNYLFLLFGPNDFATNY